MTNTGQPETDSKQVVRNLLDDLNSEEVRLDCGHYVKFKTLSVRNIKREDHIEIVISCTGCVSLQKRFVKEADFPLCPVVPFELK